MLLIQHNPKQIAPQPQGPTGTLVN